MGIDLCGAGEGTRTRLSPIVVMAASVMLLFGCSRAASVPPLNFNSSGSLIRDIQGFRLGMSLPDALRADPQLRDWYSDAPALPTKLDCDLTTESRRPFHDDLEFAAGRLIWIESSVDNVDPTEAPTFEADLISSLGQPTKRLYAGPDEKDWIWIDGDVRVRYNSVSSGGDDFSSAPARRLVLDSAVYPVWVSKLETKAEPPRAPVSKDWLVKGMKRDWGDGPSHARPAGLQRTVEGFGLGMTPEQFRSMFPAGRISDEWHRITLATLEDPSSQFLPAWSVEFWDRRAARVVRRWGSIKDWRSNFPALRDRLLKRMGPPMTDLVSHGGGSSEEILMGWENDSTSVEYMLLSGTGPTDPPSVTATLLDWQAVKAWDQYDYQTFPHSYTRLESDSFF